MKRLGLFCCMLLIPALIIATPEKITRLEDAKGCTLVLSKERSGVNWLMCSLQFLTRRALCPPSINFNHPMNNRLKFELNETKPPFIRSHGKDSEIHKINKEKNQIVYIIRNYKETKIRQFNDNASQFKASLNSRKAFKQVINHLKYFETWPEENRYVIYYEDLLTDPREALGQLLAFLGEDDTHMDEYIERMPEFKQRCLSSYNRQVRRVRAFSRGNDLLYHSKKVPYQLLLQADELFKSQEPGLWEKYMSRYETFEPIE